MKIAQPYPALTFDNVNRQLAELYRLANKQISIDNIKSLAGLPALESDITDGTILARVASDETISGNWTHTGKLTVADLVASADLDIGPFQLRARHLVADDGMKGITISDNLHIITSYSPPNPSWLDIHTLAGYWVLKIQGSPTLDDWFDQSVKQAASPTFAGLNVVDANTRLGKDINNNLTFTDIVSGTLILAELSCPPLVTLSASTQAEGNLSLTGFENKVLIKWIRITTASTNWNLTLYKRNTFLATDAFQIVDGRSGNFDIFLDYPYEDEDATKKLHINFTDVVGTATYNIEVRGYKMR